MATLSLSYVLQVVCFLINNYMYIQAKHTRKFSEFSFNSFMPSGSKLLKAK